MGLFNKLFGNGLAFNRVAKSIKHILDNLSIYRLYNDKDYLYKAAWLFKFGVLDSIEKWCWSPYLKIVIPDYHGIGRITLTEVLHIVMGKIGTAMQTLSDDQTKYIEDIIDGGSAYYEVEHLISIDLKKELMP